MKYIKSLSVLLFAVMMLHSCTKKLDDLLNNPNSATPEAADVDLFLNTVQLNFRSFYTTASDYGGQLTRQQVWYGPLYSNGFSPTSFDGMWSSAYTGVVKHVDALIPIAEQQNKFIQEGIAKLLKAYTMATLVDDFGDVPFSEADLGTANINPKADQGQSIYDAMLTLIDDAVSNLNNPEAGSGPANDLFYGGDVSKWVAFANTLKLKLLMQERLVNSSAKTQIESILADNDLINDAAQDFTYRYGTNLTSPDNRHPHYAVNYTSSGAGDYIGTYFLYVVAAEKSGGSVSSTDPRRRYYFYRQQIDYTNANSQTCPCYFQSRPAHYPEDMPFCLIGSGYWGRDHGDNSGIGPDPTYRTAWGLYPAGGKFDESAGESIADQGEGAGGKGIEPIWLSSFTYFLQAEAAIALDITTNGDARSLLEKGVRASINKVLNFPASINYSVNPDFIPSSTAVDNYVNIVLDDYDAAANDDERMNIIMKEYYIAAWGNGVEPYNNYRRTGKPANMQVAVTTSNPGYFIRSFYYPSNYVNNNVNAPAQRNLGLEVNKVFWDNNPDDFIK